MTAGAITGSSTVDETREWLDENRDDGVECPSCTQFVKVYKRRINTGMAQALIKLYRSCGKDWGHLLTVTGSRGGDGSKLRYWGFIEELAEQREDGGRAGYWRVTDEGERWLKNLSTAPKYALVYNGKLLDMTEDDRVTITEALGAKFNYTDLMNGV